MPISQFIPRRTAAKNDDNDYTTRSARPSTTPLVVPMHTATYHLPTLVERPATTTICTPPGLGQFHSQPACLLTFAYRSTDNNDDHITRASTLSPTTFATTASTPDTLFHDHNTNGQNNRAHDDHNASVCNVILSTAVSTTPITTTSLSAPLNNDDGYNSRACTATLAIATPALPPVGLQRARNDNHNHNHKLIGQRFLTDEAFHILKSASRHFTFGVNAWARADVFVWDDEHDDDSLSAYLATPTCGSARRRLIHSRRASACRALHRQECGTSRQAQPYPNFRTGMSRNNPISKMPRSDA